MLTGIPAFEACWLALRPQYPTSPDENRLIVQAMGRLVDNYAPPQAVEAELPEHLHSLFEQLAIAYFQGYVPASEIPSSVSVDTHAAQSSSQSRQEISAAVDRVRKLAQQVNQRRRSQQRCGIPLSEVDTLIVDFPEDWSEREAED